VTEQATKRLTDRLEESTSNRRIAWWLFVCCGLLVAMILVGGATRLTHSGLSIVEWQPIVGTLPPMNHEAWIDAFQKYQDSPEYRYINRGMSLEEFKSIFWWEYFHRLLGRTIGLVFLAPLLYFISRRMIRRGLTRKLLGIFLVGALQGAMGWYMVTSGLIHDPHVSQLRLAAHLGLALLLLAAMLWTALTLVYPIGGAVPKARALQRAAAALTVLIFVMALSGALVAGLRAGLIYNTFPLMHGYVLPPGGMVMTPWYTNLFSNLVTVQFDHRLLAWLLAVLVPWFWWRARHAPGLMPRAHTAIRLLLAMLVIQVSLGIGTLLLIVPTGLAVTHQAGAVLLFAAAVNATHALYYGTPGTKRTPLPREQTRRSDVPAVA